jgi:hypothetical protein
MPQIYTVPNPFFHEEKTIAEASDGKNLMAKLTDSRLILIQKGVEKTWDLRKIQQVSAEKTYAMAPLLIGGILSGFAIIGIGSGADHPYWLLFGVLIGFFLIFIGFQGHMILSIQVGKYTEKIEFSTETDPSLLFFFDLTNRYLQSTQKPIYFFIPAKSEDLPDIYQKYFFYEENKNFSILIPDFQLIPLGISPTPTWQKLHISELSRPITVYTVNHEKLVFMYLQSI